jgi:hypothetical protein
MGIEEFQKAKAEVNQGDGSYDDTDDTLEYYFVHMKLRCFWQTLMIG